MASPISMMDQIPRPKQSKLAAVVPWVVGATGAASLYHGYKRNDSIFWALGWGFVGVVAPFVALPLSLAQGFAKPKAASNPGRRRRRRRRTGR